MKKLSILSAVIFLLFSCSSSENEEFASTETQITNQTTSTGVKLNVVNSQGIKQENITVMMFKTKMTTTSAMPAIEKQVTSDANGMANFDLSSYISSNIPQTYYFEAFKKVGNNYNWVSMNHPEISISKNTQVTTSIVIN